MVFRMPSSPHSRWVGINLAASIKGDRIELTHFFVSSVFFTLLHHQLGAVDCQPLFPCRTVCGEFQFRQWEGESELSHPKTAELTTPRGDGPPSSRAVPAQATRGPSLPRRRKAQWHRDFRRRLPPGGAPERVITGGGRAADAERQAVPQRSRAAMQACRIREVVVLSPEEGLNPADGADARLPRATGQRQSRSQQA